ncbi:hypothetical protein [Rhizobium anhuiense]|nr:hypothetical protein [Rhizobium anhuiense]
MNRIHSPGRLDNDELCADHRGNECGTSLPVVDAATARLVSTAT